MQVMSIDSIQVSKSLTSKSNVQIKFNVVSALVEVDAKSSEGPFRTKKMLLFGNPVGEEEEENRFIDCIEFNKVDGDVVEAWLCPKPLETDSSSLAIVILTEKSFNRFIQIHEYNKETGLSNLYTANFRLDVDIDTMPSCNRHIKFTENYYNIGCLVAGNVLRVIPNPRNMGQPSSLAEFSSKAIDLKLDDSAIEDFHLTSTVKTKASDDTSEMQETNGGQRQASANAQPSAWTILVAVLSHKGVVKCWKIDYKYGEKSNPEELQMPTHSLLGSYTDQNLAPGACKKYLRMISKTEIAVISLQDACQQARDVSEHEQASIVASSVAGGFGGKDEVAAEVTITKLQMPQKGEKITVQGKWSAKALSKSVGGSIENVNLFCEIFEDNGASQLCIIPLGLIFQQYMIMPFPVSNGE